MTKPSYKASSLSEFSWSRHIPGEIQIYAWYVYSYRPLVDKSRPSTTLREVANLLYLADPALSRPTTRHAFRVVYFDTETERFEADTPVYGITRISPNSIHVLLEPSSQKTDSDARSAIRSVSYTHLTLPTICSV